MADQDDDKKKQQQDDDAGTVGTNRVPMPKMTIPSSGYNAARVAISPNDPKYLQKMALVGAIEGQHELNDSAPDVRGPGEPPAGYEPPASSTPRLMTGMTASGASTPAEDVSLPKPMAAKPSLMSRIGHGLERAGNIAGDVFAPATMALIPGTQLYNERQQARKLAYGQKEEEIKQKPELAELQGEIRGALAAQNNAAKASFQTQKDTDANQRTQEQIFSREKLADEANATKEQIAAEHDAFAQWMADPQDYQKFLSAQQAAKGLYRGAYGQFGPAFLAYHMLNQAYSMNPALLPVIAPTLSKMFAAAGEPLSPDAQKVIATPPLGQPLSPETGAPIGLHQPEAPTTQTRNQAQTAARVISEYPDTQKLVQDAAQYLGPVQGRINVAFLLGKVGSTGDPNKDKALQALRTSLEFNASAASRFHLNAIKSLEHFEALADAGKDSTAALQGFLDEMNKWATTSQKQEVGFGEQNTSGTPPPGSKIITLDDFLKSK